MDMVVNFLTKATLEDWEHIFAIIGAVGGFIIAVIPLWRNSRTAQATFQREKKLTTLLSICPPFHEIIKKADELVKEINEVFAPNEIIDPEDTRYTTDFYDLVKGYLNNMEVMGLLMNEVYDVESFARRRGRSTIDVWERFSKDIAARRKKNPAIGKRLFCEFEQLKNSLYKYYEKIGEPYKSKFSI